MTEKRKNSDRKTVSPTFPPSDFGISVSGRGRSLLVSASSVEGIDEVNDGRVILRMRALSAMITGVGLVLSVYEGGICEVVGKITALEFKYGKA